MILSKVVRAEVRYTESPSPVLQDADTLGTSQVLQLHLRGRGLESLSDGGAAGEDPEGCGVIRHSGGGEDVRDFGPFLTVDAV